MSTTEKASKAPKTASKAKQTTVDDHIKSAIKAAVSSRKLIQTAAVEILRHAEKCGDWTKANVLVSGLPNSVRKDSLVAWFVKFGGLRTTISVEDAENPDVTLDELMEGFQGWSGAEYIREHFQEAQDVYWDTVKKPSDPWKGFDLKAEIARLVAKANKEAKAHKGEAELKIDADTLAALAVLAGQLVKDSTDKAE